VREIMPKAAAIIPAAGTGRRLMLDTPKQFQLLAGIPILVHSVKAFLSTDTIEVIIIPVPADYRQESELLLEQYLSENELQKIQIVIGGKTRQDSVAAGMAALAEDVDLVLVHDCARPLVPRELIDACLTAAAENGAAIAAVPVHDTLKAVASDKAIINTVDRDGLWQAQTPQAVRASLLREAYNTATASGFSGTDEAALLEHAGIPVIVVMGHQRNMKITRPEDLVIAKAILSRNHPMKSGEKAQYGVKIGYGYDAHRLVEGRKLVLGGVEISHEKGLLGHSDADVLTHALCDAILGAIGDGDIGRHFPDTDQQFKDVSSLNLLKQVVAKASSRGWRLGNADITIVAQRPKLVPYFEKMAENLAAICKVILSQVNLKASTTERMGFAGREEGMAAHAVVLLYADNEEKVSA
jgi:2-C-methyl-D-erythritol 4-phosphate cytidylyltransferase/2-C-methyl-D-erythritol 2,4-cyclodiphosphate synthase